ncbi:MAG: hypothetical protein H0V29_10665 [Thermoleophilaceae bacterium]|nr:hypothetical protein [Thermoleophilaceae bacterium]
MEIRFHTLVAAFPHQPEFNASIVLPNDYVELDALWREQKIAVELDSRTFHLTQAAFERNRRLFIATGIHTIRLTDAQMDEGVRDLRKLVA